MEPGKCFSFVLLLSCASPNSPIFGNVFRFIFCFFCIRVVEAQSFVFNETLWLMATGKATREALLSHFSCYAALSLLTTKCSLWAVMPGWPALWDLGDPGWGGFRTVLCCFAHATVWQCDVCVSGGFLLLFSAIPIPEIIQCYHLSIGCASELKRHFPFSVFLVCCSCWLVLVFSVLFGCCLFLVAVSLFLPLGLWLLWTMYRSLTSSLLCPLTGWALCIHNSLILCFFATCNWTCWTTWREPRGVGQKKNREALLSEAGFEKVFRTQNWVRRSKLFCRWFCFLLGQAGCISVAAWTHLKLASYYFVASGGLFAARRRPISLLQPLGDCLRCFLLLRSLWVFAQVAGFHLNDCIEYSTAPCWPPLPL